MSFAPSNGLAVFLLVAGLTRWIWEPIMDCYDRREARRKGRDDRAG